MGVRHFTNTELAKAIMQPPATPAATPVWPTSPTSRTRPGARDNTSAGVAGVLGDDRRDGPAAGRRVHAVAAGRMAL